MRISDWSSDVCSSDLLRRIAGRGIDEPARPGRIVVDRDDAVLVGREGIAAEILDLERERVELIGGDAVKIRGQPGLLGLLEQRGEALRRQFRSEARRVGKESVSTCRSRWSP